MTNQNLKGLKVAILVTDGFEQVELERPRKALDQAGAQTQIVSPKAERVRAWKFEEWGDQLRVDVPLDQAKPQDFDALLLPGGLVNVDALRVQRQSVEHRGRRSGLLRRVEIFVVGRQHLVGVLSNRGNVSDRRNEIGEFEWRQQRTHRPLLSLDLAPFVSRRELIMIPDRQRVIQPAVGDAVLFQQ